jgi:hypothetical protein
MKPGGSVLIQWMPAEAHDRRHAGMGRVDGEVTTTTSRPTSPPRGYGSSGS